jgi:hypothetical protein
MRYYKNGESLIATIGQTPYQEISKEEYEQLQKEAMSADKIEKQYWASVPYDEAVNAKIRERYTESQEFAILRQKDDKPNEYAEYYAYCEECKAFVKEKKSIAP